MIAADEKRTHYNKEDGTIFLEDESHTLFLSTCGEKKEEVPEGLVKFLKYVRADLSENSGDFQDKYLKFLFRESCFSKYHGGVPETDRAALIYI